MVALACEPPPAAVAAVAAPAPAEESVAAGAKKATRKASAAKVKMLWREFTDAKSGRTYYHNKTEGITTWTRPSDEEMARPAP